MKAAVVLPVRNGEAFLEESLMALRDAARDAELVVVDDGSTDGTASLARRLGARVLTKPLSVGPYGARNVGWRATSAELVVFTDMRCRPEPGWLASLSVALEQPGVVIAGCDVRMVSANPTIAERWAVRHQPLSGYLDHEFMPYVPTACLAIRREHLAALGGFEETRSGADADLCWRAQLAGLGSVVWADTCMWARPRSTQRAVVAQFERYGRSGFELQLQYGYRGRPPEPPQRAGTAWRALRGMWADRSDLPVGLLQARLIIAYEQQFRRAARAHRRGRGKAGLSDVFVR